MSEESLYELACPKAFEPVVEQVKPFIADKVAPVEEEFHTAVNEEDIWRLSARQSEILEGLKAEEDANKVRDLTAFKILRYNKIYV